MPPAAATAAGRSPKTRSKSTEPERQASARGGVQYAPRPSAPRPAATRTAAPSHTSSQTPRRPARSTPSPRNTASARTAAAAAAHATRTIERPVAPSRPRRRRAAEPARAKVAPRERARRATLALPRPHLRPRALRLDRIVRGRAWIPVLGVMLIAIVGMRIEVLKLGTNVGASVQEAAKVQDENGALQSKVAALADPNRIENLARHYGMVTPGPTSDTFLSRKSGSNVAKAIAGIHKPSPTSFDQNLVTKEQAYGGTAYTSLDTADTSGTVATMDDSTASDPTTSAAG